MVKWLSVIFLFIPFLSSAQKEDYVWRLGSNCGINFNSSQADSFSLNKMTPLGETNAGVCDSAGNLQFFTNGIVVFNSESDTMLNGDSLNPTVFTSTYNPLPISQADIVLKRPGYGKEYYLFHETLIDDWNLIANVLYLTKIDMALDSGKGGVTTKNLQFYSGDTLIPGNMTAVRHANGHDWWLITRKFNPCIFYTWLIQEDTIQGPFAQSIVGAAPPFPPGFGQACFSPNGEIYAAMYTNKHLYVYDLDRCSGELTFKFTSYLNDSSYAGTGCAFSSTGQFLYVSTPFIIYQFDMNAVNIDSSKQVVAVFDGFASPDPPNYTRFTQMRLARDTKIYVSTDNGCDAMHVIEYPDLSGIACNVMQHSFYFSDYFANVVSVPNIPDYKLGPLENSCDSSMNVEEKTKNNFYKIYPNPVEDFLTINMDSETLLDIFIYDVLGNLVLASKGSTTINVRGLKNGIYLVEVLGKESKSFGRFFKK
jgi:hypothetical protein